MPFGLSGAPATFQSLMIKVLKGVAWKYALCYVNNVIIFSKNFKNHLKHITKIFRRLKQAGLKLSPSKCKFAKKLHYLGHVLIKSGIKANPKKVKKVKNLVPQKIKKVLKIYLVLQIITKSSF